MKVRYYIMAYESDIYDVDDDLEEEELYDLAWEWARWARTNGDVGFEIVKKDD